jgi:hypothetical protein
MSWVLGLKAGLLAASALALGCAGERARPEESTFGASSGAAPGPPAAEPLRYPADPAPLAGEGCRAHQLAHWQPKAPPECAGKRTCVDGARRFWVNGAPFFPRGVYNGGHEYASLAASCPPNAPCRQTTPKDAAGFVAMLASAGFNLVMDRTLVLDAALRAAVHGDRRVFFAHLLWSEVFTAEGHDAMVAEIEEAAADGDVVMWFGPDEIDLWNNWAQAAAIRRLLRGASVGLDALLAGRFAPPGTPYLPPGEPAHDPHGLPFGAALAYDPGLAQGTLVYDVLLPVTYPVNEPYSLVNEGVWGTWRIDANEGSGVPVVPVLQMVGIPEMDLWQPSPEHVEALQASALARGARGAFYYNLIGDKPSFAGRRGWFAADDAASWAAYTRMHALGDRLLAVTHGGARESAGLEAHLEWRAWTLGERRVVLIANPTPYERRLDLDAVVAAAGRFVRHYEDCAPFTARASALGPFASLVLEVYP